jgi:glycerol-3-phosphate cytidylyltransferase
MRLIYTAGVWDMLHRGHLNFLWESKKLGDILVVGVVTDEGCLAYKGKHPVEDEYERFHAIQPIPWIDVVVYQDGTDPSDNLRQFWPDAMTHGDDWYRLKAGHETLEELGIDYVTIPYTKGISSTLLREGRT